MPAFNPLCGGIAVNKEPIIGPFEKILNVKNANVYLLDGSSLGKVKDIK
jgi:metallophosphoesterase superfamily enzyme